MRMTRSLAMVPALLLMAACSNYANVRTFAGSLQVVTTDTATIVAADEASCAQNSALQAEYVMLEHQQLALPDCAKLRNTLSAILIESQALQAYGAALATLAQDQFVTSDADAKAATAGLSATGLVQAPVVTAVSTIFGFVETAALEGYRKGKLLDAMTGANADAFKTLVASFDVLSKQYAVALRGQIANIDIISNVFAHNHGATEPLATMEVKLRLATLKASIAAKAAALKDFNDALAKLDPAFDAAADDTGHPSDREIYESIKTFAGKAKTVHAAVLKAFGAP
jgi:hypothetical protein